MQKSLSKESDEEISEYHSAASKHSAEETETNAHEGQTNTQGGIAPFSLWNSVSSSSFCALGGATFNVRGADYITTGKKVKGCAHVSNVPQQGAVHSLHELEVSLHERTLQLATSMPSRSVTLQLYAFE